MVVTSGNGLMVNGNGGVDGRLMGGRLMIVR